MHLMPQREYCCHRGSSSAKGGLADVIASGEALGPLKRLEPIKLSEFGDPAMMKLR